MLHRLHASMIALVLVGWSASSVPAFGQNLPTPAMPGQASAENANNADLIAGVDAIAAQALIERLAALISDSKAHPDQRARACEYLSKFGHHGPIGADAVKGFIEQQLATGQLKHFFQEKPTSAIIYPAGAAERLGKVAYALGEMGPAAGDTLPLLKKMTTTSIREAAHAVAGNAASPTPRSIAAEAIGKIEQASGLETLISITNNDPHSDTRTGAVRGPGKLVHSDDPRVASKARAQLSFVAVTDVSQSVQEHATKTLDDATQLTARQPVAASARRK